MLYLEELLRAQLRAGKAFHFPNKAVHDSMNQDHIVEELFLVTLQSRPKW